MLRFLLTIVFFVSSLALGLFVIYPKYESFKESREELNVKMEELENIMYYVAEMKSVEIKIAEYSTELKKLEKAFPADHDAPALFFNLENIIRRHNLTGEGIGSYSVSPFGEHPRINKVSFSLIISGNYENIKGFFLDIEKIIRIIKVNSVSIAYNEEQNTFNVTLSAQTYSR